VQLYWAFGRTIRSDVALPGALLIVEAVGSASLVVRLLPPLPSGEMSDCVYSLAGETLLFSAPGVARYACRPGEIDIAPVEDANPDDVQALLIATALPAILWMEAAFVLHAGAIVLPGRDRAIALAGPSGIGKSTIVAQLVEAGARLVADDSLCIERRDAGLRVSGLPGGLFAPVEGSDRRGFRVVPRTGISRGEPLGAIVILSRNPAGWAIERLAPIAAVEQLLANRHRPRIPAILGRTAQVLRICAEWLSPVPVHQWSRTAGSTALSPAELEALERL
jgi:hypothetical protein